MEKLKTEALPRASSPSARAELAARLLSRSTLLGVYIVAALFSAASKLLVKPPLDNGHDYAALQNYAIFRNAFFHLIHHQDLYARYVLEYGSYYRYSPAFALLMAPFAAIPYWLGGIIWTLLNALALFFAVWAVPDARDTSKACALWFMLIPLVVSMQNAQSNGIMAALMLSAWILQERGRPVTASLAATFSVFIKLFGGLSFVPCLLVGARRKVLDVKFLAGAAFWGALLATIPLLVVGPRELLSLYISWRANLQRDQASWEFGLDVKGLAKSWFHVTLPDHYLLPAAVAIFLGVLLIRRDAWSDRFFRLLTVASALIWVVIFNFRAESPTMIIAVTGVAIWYFLVSLPRSAAQDPLARRSLGEAGNDPPARRRFSEGGSRRRDFLLLLAVFLFTCLATTDAVPRPIRRQLPFHLEVAPVIFVWLKIQYDLLRFRPEKAAPPAAP